MFLSISVLNEMCFVDLILFFSGGGLSDFNGGASDLFLSNCVFRGGSEGGNLNFLNSLMTGTYTILTRVCIIHQRL